MKDIIKWLFLPGIGIRLLMYNIIVLAKSINCCVAHQSFWRFYYHYNRICFKCGRHFDCSDELLTNGYISEIDEVGVVKYTIKDAKECLLPLPEINPKFKLIKDICLGGKG